MTFMHKVARKSKLVIASALIAVGLTAVGAFALSPAKAYAAACDNVNIIRCGLEGSTTNGYINSLQSVYEKNSDNGHSDIRKVMNWSGLSTAEVENMSTSNTKLGTIYRNGDVKVNGKVVATDAWVSARFTEGSGFTKISDGVWARKTTTSFANASQQVLVHYDGDTVDSVVIIDCGNAVKVTPVKPEAPKPEPKPVASLSCDNLNAVPVANNSRSYRFTVNAALKNTTIQSYTFKFSDGTTKTVTTSRTAAETTHTFKDYAKTYTAKVYINGADQKNVSATDCEVRVTTPAAPVKPVEECKPGIPVGDERCEETVIPETPDTPVTVVEEEEEPEELAAAGPAGIVGLFAGTSVLGALGHRFIRNRFNRG